MLTKKLLLHSALKFVGFYMLIMIMLPSFGFKDMYASFFRSQAQFFVGSIAGDGLVDYEAQQKMNKGGVFDTRLVLKNKKHLAALQLKGGNLKAAAINIDSWIYAAYPTFFLICLILATPLSFRQKILTLVFGFILMQIFILCKLYLRIIFEFSQHKSLEVAQLGDNLQWLVNKLYNISILVGSNIIVAVFIWLVLSFRWSQLVYLLDTKEQS